jgi:PhoH-like ATPase
LTVFSKIYVLDTSALISDPQAYKAFPNSSVILPVTVLDEIDKLKKSPGDVGRNCRLIIRELDQICQKAVSIKDGFLLENGSLLSIDIHNYKEAGNSLYGDTRIISCAINTKEDNKDAEVTVVSNDINMRVRAHAYGLFAQGHEVEKKDTSDLYSGVREIHDPIAAKDLKASGSIFAPSYDYELFPNECVLFTDKNGTVTHKTRESNGGNLKIIKKCYPWGLNARNVEQELAIDLLMDPKIPLVSLVGMAGTGKSLVALACALDLVLEKKIYDKMIIYRPIEPVGGELGFTPGDISEKLAPWFQSTMDNFEILFSAQSGDKWELNFEMAKKKNRIQFEAMTYIRGRSIPNALIILEECQNISKEDMKTILTRIGDDSKICVLGDVEQIDNRRLDATNNGLSYLIEKFKTSELAGHVTFKHGERSPLASLAAEIL